MSTAMWNTTLLDVMTTDLPGVDSSSLKADSINVTVTTSDQVDIKYYETTSPIAPTTADATIPGSPTTHVNNWILSSTNSWLHHDPGVAHATEAPELDLSSLGLVAIIVLTLFGNVLVCFAVKIEKRLHSMTYYFLISMAILHILMAAVVMPLAIKVVLHGSFPYSEEVCKLWITLDLFFCNNTSLHLAFCNMDTFLRLKDPFRQGRATPTCSIILWISASWIISCVQGIAQFMLSQGDHGIVQDGICLITDKNFVILGTIFSFLIPTIISLVFYCMCVFEIKTIGGVRLLEESEASLHNGHQYGSAESIVQDEDDISDSASCMSDQNEPQVHNHVHLAVVTADVKDDSSKEQANGKVKNGGVGNGSGGGGGPEETTSFCNQTQHMDTEGGITNLSFADHIMSTDQSSSCTLLLRDVSVHSEQFTTVPQAHEQEYNCPEEHIRTEQAISRLMFLLLVAFIALWVPFCASNVVYGVCISCRHTLRFDEINTFKWLAYSTAFLGPIFYSKFSEPMRDAYWKIFTCRFCRK